MDRVYIGRRRQYGGNLSIYAGKRYQVGGGIFSTLGRFLKPLAKKAGKSLLRVGHNVLQDVISGKDVKSSFKEHAIGEAKQAFKGVKEKAKQVLLGAPPDTAQPPVVATPISRRPRKRKSSQSIRGRSAKRARSRSQQGSGLNNKKKCRMLRRKRKRRSYHDVFS